MGTTDRYGMSAQRLELLDDVMRKRYVDSGLLPGFHVMIHRDGEVAHDSLVGIRQLKSDAAGETDAKRTAAGLKEVARPSGRRIERQCRRAS